MKVMCTCVGGEVRTSADRRGHADKVSKMRWARCVGSEFTVRGGRCSSVAVDEWEGCRKSTFKKFGCKTRTFGGTYDSHI